MSHTLAQIINPVLPQSLGGKDTPDYNLGTTIVGNLISNIVGLIFIFSFLLTFLYLITGAIQWVTSGGDKSTLETARNKITHAILGLIIVAAAYAVMSLVSRFVGFSDFPKLPFPTINQSLDSGGVPVERLPQVRME